MKKSGHLLLGVIIGFLFIYGMNKVLGWFDLLNYQALVIYLIIILIYALLPDCDLKNSTITWWFIGIGILGIVISYVLNNDIIMICAILLLGLTYIAAEFFPHRGPTHTIWFAALTCVPIYIIIGWQEAILALLVYYSHLVSDGEYFRIGF